MALSQRRSSSLLDAVGAGRRSGGAKTTASRTSPGRTTIPVKPPVVKAVSRIPVTRPASSARKPPLPTEILSDLSWKFDSRAASPDVLPAAPAPPTLSPPKGSKQATGRPPIRPKSVSLSLRGASGVRKNNITQSRKDAVEAPVEDTAQAQPKAQPTGVAVGPSAGAVATTSQSGQSGQSEEQAIHDLQELVRRQQEELELYQHPDEHTSLLSCALVQQVSKAEVVVVDGVDEEYAGELQVKAIRLEDQDLPHEVLQDPRLAATRSRLNQRLQHLLDDSTKQDVLQDPVNEVRDDEQGMKQVAVGDLLGPLDSDSGSDSKRRSVYFAEGIPSTAILEADWEPQELADIHWPPLDVNHHQPGPGSLHFQHNMAAADDSPWQESVPSHKDQYHQEIRQLLEKLNSDEAVFAYAPPASTEPIYATAKKRNKTATTASVQYKPGQEVEREGEGRGEDETGSVSLLDHKVSPMPPLHPQQPTREHAAQAKHVKMSPLLNDDADLRHCVATRVCDRSDPSDLSLGSSSGSSGDNTDDGIAMPGDERLPLPLPLPGSWSGVRTRGTRGRRDAVDLADSRDCRDLSMDSGIQGSSCDLDAAESSTSASSSSASDPHDDDPDTEQVLSRPAPIGGCASPPGVIGEGPYGPEGEQAFKVVEELYVADAAVPPAEGDGLAGLAGPPSAPPGPQGPQGPPLRGGQRSQRSQRARMFTETHFDTACSAPALAALPLVALGNAFSSAPVGLDTLDRLANPLNPYAHRTEHRAVSVNSVTGNSLLSVQQTAVGAARSALSASVSNLAGREALPSPPAPFRRAHFRDTSGLASSKEHSKRFNSADDVFRASLLRHSLPAKPPRSPSVRASLEDDLSKQPYENTPAAMPAMPAPLPTLTATTGTTQSLNLAPDHQVVVAIDFGTTYSGYAFSYTRDPDCNIHMMRKWEGGDPGLYNEKAPTSLLLTPEGKFHSFGFLARDSFHDLHPDHAKRWMYFDKFKMALLSQTTLTRDTTLAAANGRQIPALTVLSMSLAHLRERALAELAAADQGHPGDLSVDGDLAHAVRWVLTVPALWGPSATQLLREAAHMAGLASPDRPEALLIVLEPEAASLCCRQLRLHQLHQLHQASRELRDQPMASLVLDPQSEGQGVRTQYMVVDCGGGTVDITVHALSGQRATLRELHKASGGACGSLGVDREFERLLSSVFGADFISHFRRKRPAAYVELLLSFEARKRSADPERESTLTIFPPFAFVEAYRKFRGKEVEHAVRKFGRPGEISWSSQGMLRLSPQLMTDLFAPTLDQVCQQVEEVLRSPRLRSAPSATPGAGIQYLFLVGGFAQSLMLQHRVRSQFGSRVKVVVPQAVGLTTLRGAVLYGMDPSLVASRRSKHTIGVGVLKRFQPGEHPQDKLVTLSDGSKWCCDVLDVLVVADQPLGPAEAVTRSYTPASARQTNIIIHIYCTSDTAPPKFVTDAGVSRCGTLRLSLDSDLDGQVPGQLPRPGDATTPTREIVARIEFGGTELAASAQDIASGRCVRTQLDFLSTAV